MPLPATSPGKDTYIKSHFNNTYLFSATENQQARQTAFLDVCPHLGWILSPYGHRLS
jgi:hypothetical protein